MFLLFKTMLVELRSNLTHLLGAIQHAGFSIANQDGQKLALRLRVGAVRRRSREKESCFLIRNRVLNLNNDIGTVQPKLCRLELRKPVDALRRFDETRNQIGYVLAVPVFRYPQKENVECLSREY
jgi:hypothetical protein